MSKEYAYVVSRGEISVQVCHAKKKILLNSNYSTLHSNRHMLPLCTRKQMKDFYSV